MIKAIAFDLDGTITRPFLNFKAIRLEIGVPQSRLSVLDQIEAMPPQERAAALAVLTDHERQAADNAELNHGVTELLSTARSRNILCALITRNSDLSTRSVLAKLNLAFDRVITRDTGLPLKPHPAPVLDIIAAFNILPNELLMVGDYRYDVESGRAAGAVTCLVDNGDESADDAGADFRVTTPAELIAVLDQLIGAAS